jgi:hypothetical protein
MKIRLGNSRVPSPIGEKREEVLMNERERDGWMGNGAKGERRGRGRLLGCHV